MIKAYQCPKQGATLSPFEYEPSPLGPHDISIKISHCGICHSDIHLIDNDWELTEYPLVPGHEIVGTVLEKGPLVDHLEVGQRIGIGWQGKSCMGCEWCLSGDENLCADQEGTCVGHYGGFADGIVADGRFAFVLPDSLPSAPTAPLLCGGATVFAPFIEHKIGPTMKVAVVGIGGLGHLALQFAHAFGCELTALSSNPEKEKEAKAFGADHFICIQDPAALEKVQRHFDFILSSSISSLDWTGFLAALRPRGKLCLLGGLEKNVDTSVANLVGGRKVICGSNIGSRPVIKQMLTFAARHNILPQIEEFPIEKVNEAIAKVRAGKMRYRAVLRACKEIT